MRNRKSAASRRERRRRFLLQLLAAIGISTGASAVASETALAYYTPDPDDTSSQVMTVSGMDSGKSIVQTAAIQQVSEAADDAIPSSSDRGDVFLDDPPEIETVPLAPGLRLPPAEELDLPAPTPDPAVGEPVQPLLDQDVDVDDVVDRATAPQPFQPPLADGVNALTAPLPPTRSRASLGAVAGGYASAPNMMGDFFGATFVIGSALGHTVALAGGDRRFKIAENTSPIPQDRIFFNYNHFHNALRDVNERSRNLDRFVFGVEKTFLHGLASIEARLPLAHALRSTQDFRATDLTSTELGNLATTLKFNLLSGDDWLLAGGTSMIFPTGDDYVLAFAGRPELVIQNEAYHIAPFIGMLKANCRWFAQGFIQADFDLNGNDVLAASNGFEGVIQDQHLLFIDASLGHWLYRNCNPCARLSGVAAIIELHYTTTMNDTDEVAEVRNNFNRMDILNATGALNFQLGRTAMRVGAAAPLRGDEENLFDAEILFQLNHNY